MRRVLALTAALLTTAVVAMPAAAAERPAIEILSPQPGADHVTTNRPMRVRVRLAPGVRLVRAVAAGRKQRVVTRRLHRGRGRIWTGTLRIGRELDRGPGALSVRGRLRGERVAAGTHFFVISRRAEMLRVRGIPRTSAARPLHVRLKTAKRVDDVRVRVNGHGARDAFTATAGGTWRATLSSSHWMRFGRNRVVITAYDRDGAFERVKRVVSVRRGQPFAGAGKDRLIGERDIVRLDGRTTLPRKDRKLRLTWRIVRRPKGSKAQLANPHAVRPTLRPDRPGIYRVRLTASARRTRGTALAGAAQSSDTAQSSDVVNVGVQPATRPEGVRVQTIGANDGQAAGPGIGIEESDGWKWRSMGAGAVQMIVLDGGTLELLSDTTYPGTDAGMASLQADVSGVAETSVVILQHPTTRSIDLSNTGAKDLVQALQALGVDQDGSTGAWSNSATPVPTGGWSVVSATDGRPAGSLIGLQASPDRPVGEMDGFLRNPDGTDVGGSPAPDSTYVFFWPNTFNTFDTHSGGDGATYNEMTIAGQTYRSDTISSGSSAFHVVWLDGGTLALRGQATIMGDQTKQLLQTLTGIRTAGAGVTSPSVVFMTTIGHPNIPRPSEGYYSDWPDIVDEISLLGGNPNAFLSLNGSANAEYSLVGAALSGDDVPNAGEEVSRILEPSVPAPRVVGVVDRKPGGAWSVSSGGSPSGSADFAALMPDIKRLLAQPDQPFQPLGEPATEKCIADALNVDYEPPYGIRASYWDPGRDDEWGNLLDEINHPTTYMPECIDDDGFQTVQTQLAVEFDAVSRIRTYFGTTLHDALSDAYNSNQFAFDGVNDYIISRYPPQQPEAQGVSPFDIVEGVLDIGAELVPEGGEALGVVGATIEIAGAIAEAGDSSDPYLGATVYEAQASQFASTLKQDFHDSLTAVNRVADLLVSDAGRLQEAGRAVRGDWKINSDELEGTVERSISAYMYGSLLPTTFKAYQCVMPPEYYGHTWYPAKPLKTPQAMRYAPFTAITHHWVKDPNRDPPFLVVGSGSSRDYTNGDQINDGWVTIGRWWDGTHEYLDRGKAAEIFGPLDSNDLAKLGQLPVYFLAPQPNKDAPGFDFDQGSFVGLDDDNSHAQYTCGGNWWNEDTG